LVLIELICFCIHFAKEGLNLCISVYLYEGMHFICHCIPSFVTSNILVFSVHIHVQLSCWCCRRSCTVGSLEQCLYVAFQWISSSTWYL